MPLTKATYFMIRGTPINVLDFGAVGDWNGSSGTDNLAAFNAAIAFAVAFSYKPTVYVPAGSYKLSGTLNLNTPGLTLMGEEVAKAYGPTILNTSVLVCDHTNVGVNTYITPGDGSGGSPYIQIKNINIDGNSKCTVGFDGGFVQQLESVNILGCTIAGARLNGQTTRFTNCAFNGNYDGVLITDGTTFTFDTCTIRENTRNGLRGVCNASLFTHTIFESNAEAGVYLTGGSNLAFNACYWEQNDAAAGASGYNLKIVGATAMPAVTFNNCVFGSIGVTQIASIDNCVATFNDCTQAGDRLVNNIAAAANAKVYLNNSFSQYSAPVGVVNADPVFIAPDTGLHIGSTGEVGTLPATTAFGTGDFTVSFAVQIFDQINSLHPICVGSPGAMALTMFGAAQNAYTLNITASQAPNYTFNIGSVKGQIGVITVVRASGELRGYFNGQKVFTGSLNLNFTQSIAKLGYDNTANRLQGVLYKFLAYSAALTDAEVANLFKNGSNPVGINTTNLVLNMNTGRRPSTGIYESVSGSTVLFSGDARWLNPTS